MSTFQGSFRVLNPGWWDIVVYDDALVIRATGTTETRKKRRGAGGLGRLLGGAVGGSVGEAVGGAAGNLIEGTPPPLDADSAPSPEDLAAQHPQHLLARVQDIPFAVLRRSGGERGERELAIDIGDREYEWTWLGKDHHDDDVVPMLLDVLGKRLNVRDYWD